MKGILFKPDMVKAIVEGRKTQTRRVMKPQPPEGYDYIPKMEAWVKPISDIKIVMVRTVKPRYQAGEVVYIKEAWWTESGDTYYRAEWENVLPCAMVIDKVKIEKWKSPLFMPEWAARYFIKITDVRAERLQEITHSPYDQDCHAEGFNSPSDLCLNDFMRTWDSINPKQSWGTNPWVFRYAFKEVKRSVALESNEAVLRETGD